jgi:hypothetical protein
MKHRAVLLWLVSSMLLLLGGTDLKADSTWVYAVQITASLQTNPPSITLSWVQDMYGAKTYTIYRKSKDATTWGLPVLTLDGSITNYTDINVQVGATYEYQIVKDSVKGYKGFGYIYSGIEAPLTEDRGTLVLVVATNSAVGLSYELARLQADLTGDGWYVIREGVSSNDTPQYVRSVITNDYYADPRDVQAVFLFGHVPVLESGYLNYDGHYTRAMPADTYYGEMNNDWNVPLNPINGPSYLPSDVALEVGRVDMFNMIGQGAAAQWPNEQSLLRNYLNKDHRWRTHQIQVQRQALMGDRRGTVDGTLGMAASGYRNFTPFVGAGNPLVGTNDIIDANIQDNAPVPQRWISMLAAPMNYLWAFGDGGGELNGCTYLGTNGEYNEVLSTDIVGVDAQAVFVMLFGSYMGNWDGADDLLRSVLCAPTMGLASMMVGEPHWFVHHMGLGETIGYGTRLSMNNTTLYQSASNAFQRAVYISLMGDPTLRHDPICPPTAFSATPATNGVALSWNPGSDPVLGYNIYISSDPVGPFTRLNGSLIEATNYVDVEPPGTYSYMVRGVRLETNPSGSYYNASVGVFANVTVAPQPLSIYLNISLQPGGCVLTWNSVPTVTYRVLSSTSLFPPNWEDISGTIVANTASSSWIFTNALNNPQCYFTIGSP